MLVVRGEQFDALHVVTRHDFELRLLRHVHTWFPQVAERAGERLPAQLRAGIERAGWYGFVDRRDIVRFVNLLCRFGWDFDATCTWARPLLDGNLPGPVKMQRLYALALQHDAAQEAGDG